MDVDGRGRTLLFFRKMPKHCAECGCNNKSTRDKVSFHRFAIWLFCLSPKCNLSETFYQVWALRRWGIIISQTCNCS